MATITDAKCISQALKAIVPDFPSGLIHPLILTSQHESGKFGMFLRVSGFFLSRVTRRS
jgi:hypothetical protein